MQKKKVMLSSQGYEPSQQKLVVAEIYEHEFLAVVDQISDDHDLRSKIDRYNFAISELVDLEISSFPGIPGYTKKVMAYFDRLSEFEKGCLAGPAVSAIHEYFKGAKIE